MVGELLAEAAGFEPSVVPHPPHEPQPLRLFPSR